jgi:hypothetical protein
MIEQVQGAMSSVERYRMAMNIVNTWEAYRTPVLYLFGTLLVLTIIVFVMKSCWKKWLLFFTILTGLIIVALDGFKMYVAAKKEAVKTEMIEKVPDVLEKIADTTQQDSALAGIKGLKSLIK